MRQRASRPLGKGLILRRDTGCAPQGGGEVPGGPGEVKLLRVQGALGHHNNVRAKVKIMLVKPEVLPDQTLDPIAPHGLANFSAHRQPKTPIHPDVFPLEHKEGETL